MFAPQQARVSRGMHVDAPSHPNLNEMKLLNSNGTRSVADKIVHIPAMLIGACLLAAFGAGGCVATYPVAPGPAYVAAPAAVSVEVGDRPYYTRGPGYYVGRAYYVWRPGHWSHRGGARVWVHGHYVVRG